MQEPGSDVLNLCQYPMLIREKNMPRRLVTADGKTFAIRDYELLPLGSRDVRIQVSFATPKHGTEGHILGGSVFDRKNLGRKTLRMFLPKAETDAPPAAPSERWYRQYRGRDSNGSGAGSDTVGVGDRVFGSGQIREVAQAEEGKWHTLGTLTMLTR
jgi:hypothetical protein